VWESLLLCRYRTPGAVSSAASSLGLVDVAVGGVDSSIDTKALYRRLWTEGGGAAALRQHHAQELAIDNARLRQQLQQTQSLQRQLQAARTAATATAADTHGASSS